MTTSDDQNDKKDPVEEVQPAKEDDAEADPGADSEDKKKVIMKVSADAPWSERMWEVFSTFWPLGLVAFGGPQVRDESDESCWRWGRAIIF